MRYFAAFVMTVALVGGVLAAAQDNNPPEKTVVRLKPAKAAKSPRAAKFPKPAKVRSTRRSTAYCASCERDSRGRIVRSEPARATFQRLNPCPATGKATGRCPGYVLDHIVPLKKGGLDKPWNMQWQTKAEAKAKDRIE
jgi:hypothetical protein